MYEQLEALEVSQNISRIQEWHYVSHARKCLTYCVQNPVLIAECRPAALMSDDHLQSRISIGRVRAVVNIHIYIYTQKQTLSNERYYKNIL